MRRRIFKKGTAAIIAAALVMSAMLATTAYAATPIDSSKTDCSIAFQVPVDPEGNPSFDDLVDATNIPIAIYKIASVDPGQQFTAVAPFDKVSGLDMNGVAQAQTAEQMMTYMELAFGAAKDAQPTATNKAGESYSSIMNDLETGLYLVVPGTLDVADEFTYGTVLTDIHTYEFTPYIMALPYNPYFANGGTADEWDYAPTSNLKAEQHRRTGSIELTKTLSIFDSVLNTGTFAFQITATDADGTILFSDTVGTTFKQAGSQTVTIEGVPLGTTVHIEETYGGIYVASGIPDFQMKTDTPQIFDLSIGQSIVNDPGKRLIQGDGSINHYTYDPITESFTMTIEKIHTQQDAE